MNLTKKLNSVKDNAAKAKQLPLLSKAAAAESIFDEILDLLTGMIEKIEVSKQGSGNNGE